MSSLAEAKMWASALVTFVAVFMMTYVGSWALNFTPPNVQVVQSALAGMMAGIAGTMALVGFRAVTHTPYSWDFLSDLLVIILSVAFYTTSNYMISFYLGIPTLIAPSIISPFRKEIQEWRRSRALRPRNLQRGQKKATD